MQKKCKETGKKCTKKYDENRQILEKMHKKTKKWHIFCELYKQRIGKRERKKEMDFTMKALVKN